jgi:radical SAM superfamily enzyme YgiQ (UPF0313 family)
MRILFLIPPKTTILNRDFAATQLVPSVGVASMIGNIQNDFPETGFIDAFAERQPLKAAVNRIMEFKPDVVAMSALTTQINDAGQAAAELKKLDGRVKILVGGPHTSKIPEYTLREFPAFDYTAAGEGEEIVKELLASLRDGAPTDGIKGLYTLRNGEIVTAGPRLFMEDLDDLEFPEWKHFNWSAYCASFRLKWHGIREIPVSINRGCPFNCIFCAKIMGDKVRKRKIPAVIEEIERDIADFGARQILFTDETFTVDRKGVVELCENLLKKNLNKKISWLCDTRPDMLDEELAGLMAKAGCFCICFGADSVSDQALRYVNKKTAGSNIFNATKICRKHGIITQAAYILGLPTDTVESIKTNVRGALKANSDFATFSILVPFPGTKMMEMAKSGTDGLTLLSEDWRLYGKQLGYAMETKNLDRKNLENLQRNAYFKYYLRPGKIFNIFKITEIKIVFLYFVAHFFKVLGITPSGVRKDNC